MANDNSYNNIEPPRYGGSQPTPPPFPGDRRNQGCSGYNEIRYDSSPYYRPRPNHEPQQPWGYVPPTPAPSQSNNSMGTAGFVLALITTVVGWIPYVGWLIWLLAVVFSAIGMSRKPRGLATAGLIIAIGLPFLLLLAIIAFGISLAALAGSGLTEI